jgi:wyosine [tRNA(Phe)-imidazoG37] synthetase (radical SAM superfamily)
MERRSFFPPADVLREVLDAVSGYDELDHITLVGDGEPTLSSDLGLLIEGIKDRTDVPVAVLTNGSMLHYAQVRKDLMRADRVLPTLSTTDLQVWRRMHRPHRDLVLAEVVRGLKEFSEEYEGDLWVEVMMVGGLNDGEGSLMGLFKALQWIGPERVDILVPTRPPTEAWVEAPSPERVLRAVEVLGARDALSEEPDAPFGVGGYSSVQDALLSIGSRHPLREDAAEDISFNMGQQGAVTQMIEDGEMVRVLYRDETFLLPHFLVGYPAVSYHDTEVT